MSRRYVTRWPTHRTNANRRRRPRPRRPPVVEPFPESTEGMAQSLVNRGLATPQILSSHPKKETTL